MKFFSGPVRLLLASCLLLVSCLALGPASASAQRTAAPSSATAQPQSVTAIRTIVTTRKGKTSIRKQPIRTFLMKFGQSAPGSVSKPPSAAARPSHPKSITLKAPAAAKPKTKVHPRFGGNTIVNSQALPDATIAGTPTTVNLNYPSPGEETTYTFAIFAGLNFSIQGGDCNADQCFVTIAFNPLHPGPLKDAVSVTDQNGNLVYETFVYGNGIGPQFGYDLGNEYILGGSNQYQPAGIAIGPGGNYFFSDQAGKQVFKVIRDPNDPQNTSTPASLGFTGLGTPAGVAVDGFGTVYVADQTNNVITYLTVAGRQANAPTSQLSNPQGIAVDGTGALYICDTGNDRIIKIDNQGNETSINDEVDSPQAIAIDSAGDIFYTDEGSGGEITEISAAGTFTQLQSQLGQVQGIALDPSGRIYYSTAAGFGTYDPTFDYSTFGSNLAQNDGPYAVVVDNNGDVLTTHPADGTFTISDRYNSNFILATTPNSTTSGTITSQNTGTADLTFTNQAIPGPVFTIDDSTNCTSTTVLQSGETCTTVIDFTPPDDNSYQQNYVVTSNSLNAPGSTDNFTVYGQGEGSSTSTTLTTSGQAALVNTPVTLTATVANTADIDAIPTGSVEFTDNNNFLVTVQLAQGQTTASYTTSSLPSGGNVIQAIYSGDTLFSGSQSAGQNVQIDPTVIQTATSLQISAATIASGQIETLTALVAGEYTQPSGTVTFSDQHGVLGTVAVTGSGQSGSQAVLTLGALTLGTHTITATYNGDATFSSSTSTAQTVTVTGISTTTALTVSPATVAAGQPETLMVTVTPAMVSGMQPDGSATYLDTDGSIIGTSYFTGYSPTSQFTISTLTVGQHIITAVYSGDQTYAGSTSPSQTVTVTSTTSLTITPATTTYQTPVTFHASTAASHGQIVFCDAAAPQCSATSNLAIAQVNSDGNASVKLPAGTIGAHSFIATFLGTAENDGAAAVPVSTSTPATVTVTGTYPTTTALTAAGAASPYTLTGTVVGLGSSTLAPTGQLTFNDTSNTTTPLLGTASLGAGTLAFTAVQPTGSPLAVGAEPYGVATGDFNNDGFADIVTENYGAGTISVLLGNGDGTFAPAVTYSVGSEPERVLTADFNGDGILDLVVANTASNNLSILLGNGDGTFQDAVNYAAGTPVGLGVLDLNHDGYPDIAVSDYYNGTMSVLINNGDGTFEPAATYPTSAIPQTLAEGDFNGDGNIDIVVGSLGSATVGVLLGNGDGTFQPQVTYPVGSGPQGIQVADFNGDGKLDLAVTNSIDNTLGILLGNGDGTFQAQVIYPTGRGPIPLVIADFNGDGFPDIAVGNTGDNNVSYLLGKGDGTFQPQLAIPAATDPYGLAVGDFNGDGHPDLAVSTFGSNAEIILLSQVTQTATATLSAAITATGVHNLDAVYPGDTSFTASTSPVVPLTVTTKAVIAPGTSTIVASGGIAPGSPTDYTFFGNMAVEFGLAGGGQPTNLTNFTVSTLQNVEYPGNSNYTSITAPGGATPFTTGSLTENPTNYPNTTPHTDLLATFSPLHAGAFTVYILDGNTDGVYVGNSSVGLGVDGAAEIATASHALSGTNEFTAYTVTGARPSDVFQVYATTSTNAYPTIGALTFSTGAVTSPAASATTLTATPATQTAGGTVTFSATVAGTTQTSPAPTGTVTLINTSVTPNATVGTIALVSGSGSVPVLTLPTGTNAIVARYSGDTVYLPSASAPRTVTITLTAQTITFPAIPNHTVGDAPFTLAATASSNLPVTYTVTSGPATVSGDTVTLTGAPGTVTIQAAQPGNATYAPATAVSRTFTVSPRLPVTLISITPNSGAIGSLATTITLTGTNFSTSDLVQLNGATIASTYVSPTSLTAVIPASFFVQTGVGQVTVQDPVTSLTSAAVPFTVSTSPQFVFSGPPSATSGTQPKLTFTLVNPYPVALAGTLTLTFTPATATGINDPAVQFSTGGRTLAFTIPANSTVTPAVQLQTGTVAGTATIDLAVTANGVSVTPANVAPVVITIPPAVPTITSTSLKRSGNTLTVSIVGFSNTREALKATFHFTPVTGGDITDPDSTLDVTASFSAWYTTTASDAYGSAFTYTQVFTLDQDAAVIESVKVTLANTVGTSTPATTQ